MMAMEVEMEIKVEVTAETLAPAAAPEVVAATDGIAAMTGRTDRIPLGDECIGFYTGKDSDCVGGISKLNPLKSATVPQERAAGTDCEMMI